MNNETNKTASFGIRLLWALAMLLALGLVWAGYRYPLIKRGIIWGGILLPWLVLIFVALFPDLVNSMTHSRKGSDNPIAIPIILIISVLLARWAFNYNILSWGTFFLPFILLSLLLLALSLYLNPSVFQLWASIILVVVICFAYGFGATVTINCIADSSQPKIYQAQILNKYFTTNMRGIPTFYMTLAPWVPGQKRRSVRVSIPVYNEKEVGESATIGVHQGGLHMPWFEVEP